MLFGVESCCVTKLRVEGRKVFRMREGVKVPVKRIYNRMVFDELEVKKAHVPFRWNDELDLTWCSHPNWYWTWSKFSLPHLDHVAVPKARFLSDLKESRGSTMDVRCGSSWDSCREIIMGPYTKGY